MIPEIQWLLVVTAALLHAALVYFVSPPPIGVVPRLATSGRRRFLRLAIHNMNARAAVGPFSVTARVDGSGVLVPDDRKVRAYIGTAEDRKHLSLSRANGGGIDITVGSLRPLKTWVIEIPCSDEVVATTGEVRGKNRGVAMIIPALSEVLGSAGNRPLGDFVFPWRSRWRPHASQGQDARGFRADRWRILLTVVALALVSYALAVGAWDYFFAVWPWTDFALVDALFACLLAAGVVTLYQLVAPAWGVVAQGYLEPWEISLAPAQQAPPG